MSPGVGQAGNRHTNGSSLWSSAKKRTLRAPGENMPPRYTLSWPNTAVNEASPSPSDHLWQHLQGSAAAKMQRRAHALG